MISIQFPAPVFQVKQQQGREMIFDPLRKKWLVLTPEEWVRQNFVQYLVQTLHYPQSLIAVEKEIKVGELQKRFDIIVYRRSGQPWLLVECKAMEVPLSAAVAEQVLRYNQAIQAVYLVVTNGTFTRCFQLQPQATELPEMPPWETL